MTISKDTIATFFLAVIILVVGAIKLGVWIAAWVVTHLMSNPENLILLDKSWSALCWGLALTGIAVSLIKIQSVLMHLSESAKQHKAPQ